MKVLSKEQGGSCYGGPERVCLERWKHTSAFYILEPVAVGLYIAHSLNNRFHYQVKKMSIISLNNYDSSVNVMVGNS
jgi:hypothetical protein